MEHHTVSSTSLPLPGNLSPSSRNRSTNWAIVFGLISIITSLGTGIGMRAKALNTWVAKINAS
ncbi:hypothetical protein PCASD_15195 [Puccinia coronata f. sp. avenae]|uniref:Uncharacterized protein n=1 Tax=Puccinia coronata f. sp. avenae TaxID=200324 RepID=A0A2N5U0K3_9BASI|nr:hypothetical protein PCASD_15195 [Puccinia coronata f. sp. avenae]